MTNSNFFIDKLRYVNHDLGDSNDTNLNMHFREISRIEKSDVIEINTEIR